MRPRNTTVVKIREPVYVGEEEEEVRRNRVILCSNNLRCFSVPVCVRVVELEGGGMSNHLFSSLLFCFPMARQSEQQC